MHLLVHSFLSKTAQYDIEKIFSEKIDKKGVWPAWMEMESIRERIDDLSLSPQQGGCRDELGRGMLCVRHDKYVIYYRRTKSQLGVDILAVGSLEDDPDFATIQSEIPPDVASISESDILPSVAVGAAEPLARLF